jgi:hypothetical protein
MKEQMHSIFFKETYTHLSLDTLALNVDHRSKLTIKYLFLRQLIMRKISLADIKFILLIVINLVSNTSQNLLIRSSYIIFRVVSQH